MIRLTITTRTRRTEFSTDRTEVLIGSRDGADLRIDEPGVAPNHCLLRADGTGIALIDLGSPGGIGYAGETVRQARLEPGSAFRIADALVIVEAVRPALALALEDPAVPAPPAKTPGSARPVAGPAAPVPHGPHADFGRELRRMLARTPWYAISLAVHLLVLLVMSLIPYESREQFRLQQIEATVGEDSGAEVDSEKLVEPDLESLQENQPEEDFEALLETDRKQREEEIPMDSVERPDVLGIGQPSLNHRIRPLRDPKAPNLTEGNERVNRADAHGAQERAQAVASRGFERALRRLRDLPPNRIVVIEGRFDEMQSILDLYKIPKTTITTDQLVSYDLSRADVLCVNCGQEPSSAKRTHVLKKVKQFVERGGWLITSDWALSPYLTTNFPEFVKEHQPRRRQLDMTTHVRPRTATSPLIEGVFAQGHEARWWIEESSKFVQPVGTRTNVLIESPDLRRDFGSGSVVIEFRPSRRGRVVHLLGHFFQKDGNHAGVVGMHRLILNFLRERFPQSGTAR